MMNLVIDGADIVETAETETVKSSVSVSNGFLSCFR